MQIILTGAIAATLLAPLLWRIVRASFDPFEPIVIFAIAYGVMFVVRPLAMIIADDYTYPAPLSVIDVAPTFTHMLFLALLGAISFVGGYCSLLRTTTLIKRPAPVREFDFKTALIFASVTALIGISSLALVVAHAGGLRALPLLLRGRTPQLDEAIRSLSLYPWAGTLMLVPAALVFLALGWQRRNVIVLAAFALLAALIFLRAVPRGDRMVLLPFLGGIFIFFYLRRSARPGLLIILVLACTVLFMSTFLSDLRGRSTRGETASETFVNIVSHPSRVANHLTRGPDSEMAPVFAAALRVIPSELRHTYGTTIFGDLGTRPIPRAIWPSKPEPPRDRLIATLWPRESEKGSINPEFSVLLYFYWDFGPVGVVLGLAAFGIGARYLYSYFLSRKGQLSAQLLYAVGVWFIAIGVRDSPVDTFIRAVFMIGPLLAIFTLSTKRVMMVTAQQAKYQPGPS
jgi:hypothetical protein